jgi:hypothetical protein
MNMDTGCEGLREGLLCSELLAKGNTFRVGPRDYPARLRVRRCIVVHVSVKRRLTIDFAFE